MATLRFLKLSFTGCREIVALFNHASIGVRTKKKTARTDEKHTHHEISVSLSVARHRSGRTSPYPGSEVRKSAFGPLEVHAESQAARKNGLRGSGARMSGSRATRNGLELYKTPSKQRMLGPRMSCAMAHTVPIVEVRDLSSFFTEKNGMERPAN